eukprot:9496453-Pyramimonas_sp.AAC.1
MFSRRRDETAPISPKARRTGLHPQTTRQRENITDGDWWPRNWSAHGRAFMCVDDNGEYPWENYWQSCRSQ